MRLAATILAPLAGQRPGDAARPLVDLIDDPTPGRAANRGRKPVPLVVGPHDEQDAIRLDQLATTGRLAE